MNSWIHSEALETARQAKTFLTPDVLISAKEVQIILLGNPPTPIQQHENPKKNTQCLLKTGYFHVANAFTAT